MIFVNCMVFASSDYLKLGEPLKALEGHPVGFGQNEGGVGLDLEGVGLGG